MLTVFLIGALYVGLGFLLRSVMGDSDEKRCVALVDDLHARIDVQAEVIRGMEEAANRDHIVKATLQQETVEYAGKVVDMQNDVRELAEKVKTLRHERNVWETECRAWRASDEMRRDVALKPSKTANLGNRVRIQK